MFINPSVGSSAPSRFWNQCGQVEVSWVYDTDVVVGSLAMQSRLMTHAPVHPACTSTCWQRQKENALKRHVAIIWKLAWPWIER